MRFLSNSGDKDSTVSDLLNEAEYLGGFDFKKAIKCYDRALKLEPANVGALTGKSVLLVNEREFKKVIECYDKILKIRFDTNILYLKARALSSLGKHREAIECFDFYLSKESKPLKWILEEAERNVDDSLKHEAIYWLNKAALLEPNNTAILTKKSAVLHRFREDKEALKCLEKALSIESSNIDVLVAMGDMQH